MEVPSQFHSHPKHERSPSSALQSDSPTPRSHPSSTGHESSESVGHEPLGRTIAVHSVCILPTHQNLGLGKILLKAYMQRMESSGIADRMVMLAHEEMVGWYVGNFGFVEKGESKVTFGGGRWRELVCHLYLWR